MYLTDHDTTTAGIWITQDLTQAPTQSAPVAERIVLFKTRGAPTPPRQGGCVVRG